MKRALSFLVVLTIIFTMAACGGGAGTAESSASSQSSSDPADTSGESNVSGQSATGALQYGGLVRFTVSDANQAFGLPWEMQNKEQTLLAPFAECLLLERMYGELEPHLAASWEVDPENKEIRFKLKEGVKFTDGSEFNADVVAWQYAINIEKKAMNPAVVGVEVRDEYEVAVKLNAYNNSTLAFFSSHTSAFVSKENYEKNGEEYAREHPVGTGPFILEERIPGARVSFVKNENYWQEGKPYFDEIEYVSMTDPLMQTAAMESTREDALDVIRSASGEQASILSALPNVYTKKWPSAIVVLAPSSMDESSPLSKLEVRQAIFHAIDRESLCAARGFGTLQPEYQIIPNGFVGHLPDYDYATYPNPYDPDKAKELLAQAGYPDGFAIQLHSPAAGAFASALDQDATVIVQNMLEEVGIQCELDFPESGAATELRMKGWDGLLAHTIGAFPNSSTAIRLNVDPDYQYLVSTWRPADEIMPIYNASRETLDVEDDIVQELHRFYVDDMIVIPLHTITNTAVIKENVHDTGIGDYSTNTIWTPWNAWRSQ